MDTQLPRPFIPSIGSNRNVHEKTGLDRQKREGVLADWCQTLFDKTLGSILGSTLALAGLTYFQGVKTNSERAIILKMESTPRVVAF